MGGFAAPAQSGFTGARTYNGQGMNTQVSGPGGGGLPPGVLEALEEKRQQQAAEAAMRLRMQQAQLHAMQQGQQQAARAQRQSRNQADGGQGQGRAQQQETEAPWYSQQAVARTPVAGFNMTGDYTIDPNKLPPSMRPQGATMGAMPVSGASLSASPASNQPASGGFTAGQQYDGEGGEGGGPTVTPAGNERPDWLGTGTTNAVAQQAILIRNAAQREAQQQAMREAATRRPTGPGYAPSPVYN